MTVKIVKAGSLTKQVTCKRCHTQLEYEPVDVRSTTYMDADTITDIVSWIPCPFCGVQPGGHPYTVEISRI